MDYRCYKPPQQLEPYVDCFWSLDLQSVGGEAPAEKVLPDGKTELIFHYADHFEVSNEGGTFQRQGRGLFAGQLKTFTLLRPTGNTGMVAARFKPAGASRFFDFPLFELTNQVLDLGSVVGNEGGDLVERVLNAPNNLQRLEIVSQYLLRRLEERRDDILLRASVRFVEEGQGEIDYRYLSKKVGLSERQIERKFKAQVGISPAVLSRILRFQRFLELAKRAPWMKLTDAAHECGYYDQSHFIKDFRTFAGVSPSSFLSEPHEMSDHFISAP